MPEQFKAETESPSMMRVGGRSLASLTELTRRTDSLRKASEKISKRYRDFTNIT